MKKKELLERIKELERINAQLIARIEELERRLGLNSSNSSKPPSSDGLRKTSKARTLRDSGTNEFGGQLGHKGNTLNQTDNPDITIKYDTITCSACGNSLENTPEIDVIEKQEIDVVIQKQITAHKALVKICRCGKKNSGPIPKHIKAPVQFSANIQAIGVYLTNQFISKKRIENIFQDLFEISITDTTLMAFDEKCAQKLAFFHEVVFETIKKATVKHADETGMRVANKTEWIHLLSTELLTHYRLNEKRGNLVQGIVGKMVHDHWKPYLILDKVTHALCNAHHLRELKALIEFDKEAWAKMMYDLLKNASQLVNASLEQKQNISEQYDQIIEKGFNYHEELGQLKIGSRKRRPGHNLLIRLRDFKTETLRFLYDSDVPFTNNLAERDLRMIKLKQKVSGLFRTRLGANSFLATRSFISTVQKQGKNILQYIHDVLNDQFDIHSLIPT